MAGAGFVAGSKMRFSANCKSFRQKFPATWTRFGKFPLPLIFKFLPVWLVAVLLLGVAAADPVLAHFGRNVISHLEAGVALAAFVLVVVDLFSWRPRRRAAGHGHRRRPGQDAAAVRRLRRKIRRASSSRNRSGSKMNLKTTKQTFNQEWRQAVRDISQSRSSSRR